MTADVTREPTGGQGLREAIYHAVRGALVDWDDRPPVTEGTAASLLTDAVLALPEIAALIADADNWRRVTTGDPTEPEPLAMQARELLVRCRELEATVARVREVAEEATRRLDWHIMTIGPGGSERRYVPFDRLTRALDGESQP